MKTERNRTVSRFVHNGQNYRIHERSNPLSNGQPCTRRFILDEEGKWKGEAKNIKQARKVLIARAADKANPMPMAICSQCGEMQQVHPKGDQQICNLCDKDVQANG